MPTYPGKLYTSSQLRLSPTVLDEYVNAYCTLCRAMYTCKCIGDDDNLDTEFGPSPLCVCVCVCVCVVWQRGETRSRRERGEGELSIVILVGLLEVGDL
jgi:hypothetical protein